MAEFLVLRLRGPLMSFGAVAVDETRPTHVLPTQSMLTGLVANALGWRSKEGSRLNRLQERIVYGARLDRAGEALVDYQNAHVSKGQAMWRFRSDAPLVRSGGDGYDNVQRWRHYHSDAAVTVVLALSPADEEPTLEQIGAALYHPARPLFLGRVGCPPSGYLHVGERIVAGLVPEALALATDAEAPGAERLAEWPAEGLLAGEGDAVRRVMERSDLRDWEDDLHQGRRLVVCGLVPTPAGGER